MTGIVSYGVYIPRYRIKVSDISDVWKKGASEITSALQVYEKSAPSIDEDTVTMGLEASSRALTMAHIQASKMQSVFVGSESHPYAVNPSATIIGEFLGVGNNYFAADLEFACKAATAGMQATFGFLESKRIEYGLAVGSDVAQSRPHDVLEYSASSGAAAYILGNKKSEIIAKLVTTVSFTSDTPDFWRREGIRYPTHFGRFTGEPAYFTHVFQAAKHLLSQTKLNPSDFAYCVFHMPNGKFPRIIAQKLGFTKEQLAPSLTVDRIGNPYSASTLIGLASVLDIAKPKQKIFVVSYGSGAGSDGFIFETTPHIVKKQKKAKTVASQIEEKTYISYIDYIKKMHIL